jgi:hypothetical protein
MLFSRFSQNPLLVRWLLHGALLAGYLFLMLDIRFEHREVITETWQGWIPIAFSGLMILFGPLSLWFFEKGGKYLLAAAYLLSLIVGMVGIWFHSDGKLPARLDELLSVWQHFDPQAHHKHYPPILAPLAFLGLGTIGILLIACLTKVDTETPLS